MTRRRAAISESDVPPLVAAIVRLAEPNHTGLPDRFLQAWAAAPDLARAFVATCSDEPRFPLVDELSGLAEAEKHPDTDPELDHGRARAVAAIKAIHPGHLINITAPVSDAAFYLGIAYASYMLRNGGAK